MRYFRPRLAAGAVDVAAAGTAWGGGDASAPRFGARRADAGVAWASGSGFGLPRPRAEYAAAARAR